MQQRPHDFVLKVTLQLRRPKCGRTVRTHSASIRTFMAVAQPLVITGCAEDLKLIAGDQDMERAFPAFEKFLDQESRPSLAETSTVNHIADRFVGAECVRRDDYAFARCETVCFDYNREMQLLHETAGFVTIVEHSRHRGRDTRAAHEVFRENLRSFEPGGRLGWTKNAMSRLSKMINHPEGERIIRTDNREIDSFLRRKAKEPVEIVRADLGSSKP